MERVEVRLNLEVPRNSQLYEVRQLINSRFENVHWLDLCEDDNVAGEDRRPLIATVPFVSSDLFCDFVEDETFPDWTVVEPYSDIEKGWKVRNSGRKDWPTGTCLKLCWGDLGRAQTAYVPPLKVGEEGIVRVPLSIPVSSGPYQVHFRLFHNDHGYFGHKLWCNLIVKEESSVQVLDDDVELPPCFDLEVSSHLPSPSTSSFRQKPRQQQYRLEAEALPEAFITGALSACSSIYNVAKSLIDREREHR